MATLASVPDHRDDAPDLVARTPGAIDVGGSELGEQEMAAAEDIEGQETAVFVIAVEEGVLWRPWVSTSVRRYRG